MRWVFLVALALCCVWALSPRVASASIRALDDDDDDGNCTEVTKSGDGWKWYCCGECELTSFSPKYGPAVPGNVSLMLMGGGNDVDDAFIWMLRRQAEPVVTVLRTDDRPQYNPYIIGLDYAKSVSTFVVTTRQGASDPFVVEWVRQSTTVWFAGGDQHEYWDDWDETPLEYTINNLIKYGTPNQLLNPFTVGGTSAGLAILGEYVYASFNGSITSAIALANPYDEELQITDAFLDISLLNGLITDTHFMQRNRMGRFITFMARIMKDNSYPSFRGYAANQDTCVVFGPEGTGVLFTTDHDDESGAYFANVTASPQDIIAPGQPLTLGNPVQIMKLTEGDRFNILNWNFVPGYEGIRYSILVKSGRLYVKGNNGLVY